MTDTFESLLFATAPAGIGLFATCSRGAVRDQKARRRTTGCFEGLGLLRDEYAEALNSQLLVVGFDVIQPIPMGIRNNLGAGINDAHRQQRPARPETIPFGLIYPVKSFKVRIVAVCVERE